MTFLKNQSWSRVSLFIYPIKDYHLPEGQSPIQDIQCPSASLPFQLHFSSSFSFPSTHSSTYSSQSQTIKKLHDLQFFKNARILHAALPFHMLLLLPGVLVPYLFARQTNTYSSFRTQRMHYLFYEEFPDPSFLNIYPSGIISLPFMMYMLHLAHGTHPHLCSHSTLTPFPPLPPLF